MRLSWPPRSSTYSVGTVTADQEKAPASQPPDEPTDEPSGTAHDSPHGNRWVLLVIFIIILIVLLFAKWGFDVFFKGLGILVS